MRILLWTIALMAYAVVAIRFHDRCDSLVRGNIPPPRNTSWSFVVFIRAQDEFDILPDAIGHYFSEGAERIVLLDDRSNPPLLVDDDRVTVLRIEGKNVLSSEQAARDALEVITACRNCILKELTRLGYTWLAFVDADEFMSTKRNPGRTVAQELQTTFRDASTVLAPWLYFCSTNPEEPVSPIVDIFLRQSFENPHGVAYQRLHSKSIARLRCAHSVPELYDELIEIDESDPNCNNQYRSAVDNKPRVLGPTLESLYGFNLTETKIKDAYIVTYHYRFRSLPQVRRKCTGKSIWHKYNRFETERCIRGWVDLCFHDIVDKSLSAKTAERNHHEAPFRLVNEVITQKYPRANG